MDEITLTLPRTRGELVTLLKAAPFNYTGGETLAEVKQFVTDNDLFIENGEPVIDVDAVWKKTVAPIVVKMERPEVDADEAAAARIGGGISKKAADTNRVTAASTGKNILTPEQHVRMNARKAYDRKAARRETVWESSDEAELFGAWLRSRSAAMVDYPEKSKDLDIVRKSAGSTTVLTDAGALIAPQFLPTLIELRERYGVYEREVGVTNMRNNELLFPRSNTDCSAYWTGENSALTEAEPGVDNVQLTANKLTSLYRVSSELLGDSAINISDMVTRGMARNSALKIDQAGFVGTGTATYGGFTGITTALTDLSGTIANIAGLVVASGNLFSEFAVGDFTSAIGVLPDYVTNPKWYMHRVVYGAVVERLGRGVGGLTYGEFAGAKPAQTLFGIPVVFVQGAMPKADANSQIAVLLGDMSLAAKFGRVQNSMEILATEHRYFEYDQWGIRFRERVAIVNHDVGNASATAASKQAGPIVGIISAAS